MNGFPSQWLFRELIWRIKRWNIFWPRWVVVMILWPWLACGSWWRCHKKRGGPIKILVIPQTNRLGDLLCATPVFRAIKFRYPTANISVLVSRSKSAWEIIKANPHINKIFFYEDQGLVSRLRQQKFDWSFALTTSALPSLLAFSAMIPRRIKTVVWPKTMSERCSDLLNTNCITYQHHTSLPQHYLRLLGVMGIDEANIRPEVVITPRAEKKARLFFETLGIRDDRFIIGMSLTAGNPIKEWGDERFAELAQRLATRYKATVIFLGSKNDQARISRLLAQFPSQSFFAAQDFDLVELPALMKRFNLYVAVDTGPIYVAYGLRVPLVDIVGPVDPREQPPVDPDSLLVLPPPPHTPSVFVFYPPGSVAERRQAVDAITVESVYSQIEHFLAKR